MIEDLKQVRDALEENAKAFRWYEGLHAAKPDMDKARRNAEFAERSETALTTLDRIIGEGVVVPDGYALVPKKILESLHQKPVYGNYDYQCGYIDCLKDAKAMLSAAPQPPKNGD